MNFSWLETDWDGVLLVERQDVDHTAHTFESSLSNHLAPTIECTDLGYCVVVVDE